MHLVQKGGKWGSTDDRESGCTNSVSNAIAPSQKTQWGGLREKRGRQGVGASRTNVFAKGPSATNDPVVWV